MSSIKTFGDTARGLARNPLGIIALFIVLVYGIAALTLGLQGSGHEFWERVPLVWFLTLFPVAVLATFSWLVACHHEKLYGPGDFIDQRLFLAATQREFGGLARISSQPALELNNEEHENNKTPDPETSEERSIHRNQVYKDCRGVFLAHVLAPSDMKGQEYDIYIYLIKHKNNDLSDIKKTEFFLGSYWGNEIFTGSRAGDKIGIHISAYGPLLCTCKITFQDGYSCMTSRYIDFEMGKLMKKISDTYERI